MGWGCWCYVVCHACCRRNTNGLRALICCAGCRCWIRSRTRGARDVFTGWGLIRCAGCIVESYSGYAFFDGILLAIKLMSLIMDDDLVKFFRLEECDWILDRQGAKSTDLSSGWWLLELFLECDSIGGICNWVIWCLCCAYATLFLIWINCLLLLVFCRARGVLSGFLDASGAYFKLFNW